MRHKLSKIIGGRRYLRRSSLVIVASAACVQWSHSAQAATETWNAGSGNWATAGNWTPSTVPGDGDTAEIASADSTNRTITYDYTGTPITLASLTVDNQSDGSDTLSMTSTGTALSANFEYIGDSSVTSHSPSGAMIQSLGTNSNQYLYVGVGTGTYSLSGAGSLSNSDEEDIGYSGTGSFTQSGGTNNSTGTLILALNPGSSGSYSLSGTGSLTSGSGGEGIGYSGSGSFTQSGGTNAAGSILVLGDQSGSSGTYDLSGGTLIVSPTGGGGGNANTVYIGGNGAQTGAGGTGILTVSGNGTLTVNNSSAAPGSITVYDTADSALNLKGGTITAGQLVLSSPSQFNWTSGTLNLTDAQSDLVLDSPAPAPNDLPTSASYLGPSLKLGAGQSLFSTEELVGYEGAATLIQTGGTNTVGGNGLSVAFFGGSNGTYSLSGSGLLECFGQEYLGYGGTGTFIQSGGTNVSFGAMQLGIDELGYYSLSGAGALVAKDGEYLGATNGIGSFVQSGGTNTITGAVLDVGEYPSCAGIYNLSGGTLNANAGELIGDETTGTFNQTGGVNTVIPTLVLGGQINSSGIYNLSAGILNGSTEIAGLSGNGTFTQTGGTNVVTALYLGYTSGSTGAYSLSGAGSLSVAGAVYVGGNELGAGGSGLLTVSGGNLTVAGTLDVWDSNGTAVTVSGGTVSTANTYNLATINVTGGSANLGVITGAGTLNVGGDAPSSVTASGLQQSTVAITSKGELTLTSGGATNAISALNISGGGILNLTSTKVIISYFENSDPVTTIRAYLAGGYNSGNWNGPGIDSSSAAANHNYAIGYADSADPGNPAGLGLEQIEIAYTLYGDTNLDGTVNSIDFGDMAANFGKSGKVWDQGDFNYDGVVNSIDFGLLAANFGKSASGADVALPASDWAALDAFAAANGLMADVPEPCSAALALTIGLGFLAGRRRRAAPWGVRRSKITLSLAVEL